MMTQFILVNLIYSSIKNPNRLVDTEKFGLGEILLGAIAMLIRPLVQSENIIL